MAGSEVKLTAKDSTANLKVGQAFNVSLEANPTTGFTWEAQNLDGKLIAQTGDAEFKSDTNLTGASGMLTLRFKALAPGKTTLHLVYHRPWEKDIPPIGQYDLDVTIQ
jgi:inhibitor of cysteine peptidase